MKYEADIIKEIVDKRGHEKTSIHYQSECVEEWVKEVEGAYPKLCDYQPEWLNYSNENNIGVFPYLTLTDVTDATVENVVPYAYKRAILKGQTLVNLLETKKEKYTFNNQQNWIIEDGYLKCNGTSSWHTVTDKFNDMIKPSTKYLLRIEIAENTLGVVLNIDGRGTSILQSTTFLSFGENEVGVKSHIVTTASELDSTKNGLFRLPINITNGGTLKIRFMAIEYQEGIENWDIPYFEGMQSVKLPVLKTTGKNFKQGSPIGNFTENNGEYVFTNMSNRNGIRFDVDNTMKIGDTITVSVDCKKNKDFGNNLILLAMNNDVELINKSVPFSMAYERKSLTITIPDNTTHLFLGIGSSLYRNVSFNNIQVEQGHIATSYEPYKSNILTVNEPIELRGIGKVRDELNCLTGELTQRVGEIVLDGGENENWLNWNGYSGSENLIGFYIDNTIDYDNSKGNDIRILCSSFPTSNSQIGLPVNYEGIATRQNGDGINRVYFSFKRTTVGSSLDELKTYLQNNPILIQYKSKTESVKTVDLSVVDQDGKPLAQIKPIEGTMHLNTSGETINPLFSGEVPVEAITQNLASFIEE